MCNGEKKRLLFIYNPKAGKAKIRENLVDIIDVFIAAGYQVVVHSTQAPEEAVEVVKNMEKDAFDLVVCSGGDGTLDEVVTGMLMRQEKLPIGYIPAGSTNDFAYTLGISSDMVEAAEDIVNGWEFKCDIGKFNDDAFVYIAAFGIFTEVSYATDQHLKNVLGHTAYILEGVKSLSSIQTYYLKFESEEMSGEGDFIYGMVTNSDSVGGFKRITGDNVDLADGKFEVMLVRKPASLMELNDLARALATRKFDADCIVNFKTSSLKIHSLEPISWALDGEFGGEHKEVTIDNMHQELSFLIGE